MNLNVNNDVPQSNVLGPLLFILYVNDNGKHRHSKFLLFVDDTVIYKTGYNMVEIENKLNSDLENKKMWLHINYR